MHKTNANDKFKNLTYLDNGRHEMSCGKGERHFHLKFKEKTLGSVLKTKLLHFLM